MKCTMDYLTCTREEEHQKCGPEEASERHVRIDLTRLDPTKVRPFDRVLIGDT
jgi:hypothetical protein